MPTYSLNELASLADVTPRTIRFYISQGLLPSPDPEGKKTRYTDEHLSRLLAIKKLQSVHMPLADIRRRLLGLTAEDVEEVAETTSPPPPGAAIDYIRNLLEPSPMAPYEQARRTYASMQAPPMPAPSEPAPTTQTEPAQTRSQWERISLDPDIELHIRRPLTRANTKRVERLIAIARELFKEED